MELSKKELRLRKFGLPPDEIKVISHMGRKTNSELVGANRGAITLNATGARTIVNLDPKGWDVAAKSLRNISNSHLIDSPAPIKSPDKVYLQLEGIKGSEDSIVCSVSVNHQYAGHISLFGLQDASRKGGHHGGSGLTIRLDITKIIDQLHLNNVIDINSLDVIIQPVNIVAEGNELTIDRVSIYRQGE
jgi:tyrosinase